MPFALHHLAAAPAGMERAMAYLIDSAVFARRQRNESKRFFLKKEAKTFPPGRRPGFGMRLLSALAGRKIQAFP